MLRTANDEWAETNFKLTKRTLIASPMLRAKILKYYIGIQNFSFTNSYFLNELVNPKIYIGNTVNIFFLISCKKYFLLLFV